MDQFPILTGREFRFIRENASLSLAAVAESVNKRSGSTIYYWECNRIMKPFMVKALMEIVPEDVWNECRRLWDEKHNKHHVKPQSANLS